MHRLVRAVRVLVALAVPALGAHAQGRTAGTVVDARFRPVEGAIVSVVGRPDSARTNSAGAFRFESLTGASVQLRVQRLGYDPLTTTVRVGDTNARITLQELAINLNAVVVTGTAGVTEKRTVGNAVAQVRVADIVETAPVRDIGQLLNARAAGVVITPPGGL